MSKENDWDHMTKAIAPEECIEKVTRKEMC